MALVDSRQLKTMVGPNFVSTEWEKHGASGLRCGRPWSEHGALSNRCAIVETLTQSLLAVEFG